MGKRKQKEITSKSALITWLTEVEGKKRQVNRAQMSEIVKKLSDKIKKQPATLIALLK